MDSLIYAALFTPLCGFLVLAAFADRLNRMNAACIGCGTILFSFLSFIWLFVQLEEGVRSLLYSWISLPGLSADFSLYLDQLSLLMALMITGVGFLIHLYSIGYMDHERDYARYFACMNLFIFSMLLLVLASNLLLLFVGWEGVGLASYLLIGFWYERKSAANAATKAFVVNRMGDLGFLLALFLTFYLFGTSDIHQITGEALSQYSVGAPVITALTLLYFVGAIGKSAQLPLYVWLPDAMEGPTPVSALIHAATMVTAGVYLVVRLQALYLLAPTTLLIMGMIGTATALFAAICALAQKDLKRVLAYSTVSQLGLMFLACGVGAFYAAIFHLTTHAFVKALLFLSAGNVVHMMQGTTLMEKMGGLAKIFHKTHWLFLMGVLALAGVPPFAAFFSKELILEQTHLAQLNLFFYVALVTSILTAFYLTRAYFLTFRGRNQGELQGVHEAPRIMLLPVSVLAFLAIVGGFLGFAWEGLSPLELFLGKAGVALPQGNSNLELLYSSETLVAVSGALLGVGVAAIAYGLYRNRIGRNIEFIQNSFYIDQLYRHLIVVPLKTLAGLVVTFFEPLFDLLVKLPTTAVQAIARQFQKMQSGQIRSYVAWLAIGSVFLIAYIVFI